MRTPTTAEAGADDLAGMFGRHARELLRYCTRRVGPQLAEDVVAETFLVAHERRHRFDPERVSCCPGCTGVAEPSDEAVARVWNRIAARPTPRPAVTRRLWVPITAAAAVVALVGAGIFSLRPRTVSQPAFTTDRETVTRVIGELRDRAVTAEPVTVDRGHVMYSTNRIVKKAGDGLIYARSCEHWVSAEDRSIAISQCDDQDPLPHLLAAVRAQEATGKSPGAPDDLPSLRDVAAGPVDPTEIRAGIVAARRQFALESGDLKVWNWLPDAFIADLYLPADRLRGLFQVMAGLPVSVGETTVDGRRLVVVRYREHQFSHDLLFDPATGRWAGFRSVHIVPAGEKPSVEPVPDRTSPSPYATRSGGVVPDVGRRLDGNPLEAGVQSQNLVLTQAVVEDIGDRP